MAYIFKCHFIHLLLAKYREEELEKALKEFIYNLSEEGLIKVGEPMLLKNVIEEMKG